MLPINPRELQKQLRQLKRMGIKLDQLQNVERVVIELSDRMLILENPQVIVMEMGGQKIFNIAATTVVEQPRESAREVLPPQLESAITITEDDVRFVAEYTGVSLEEARKVLREVGGDIARAIEVIQQRKSS